jgi:phosphomannomutase
MRADRVEVSWDDKKSQWLVRIEGGEEVIRRYCKLPKNAGEQELRAAAEQTVRDEGYEREAELNIQR